MQIFIFYILILGGTLTVLKSIKKIIQTLSIIHLIKKVTKMENLTDNKEQNENVDAVLPTTETELTPTDVTLSPTFNVTDTTELPVKEAEVPTIPEPEKRSDEALNLYPSKTFKITTNGVSFLKGKVITIAGISIFRAEPMVYVFQHELLGNHNLRCINISEADLFYSELLKYENGEYGVDAFTSIANEANDKRPALHKAVEKFEAIIAEIPVIKNAAYYGFRKLTEGEFFSHASEHLKDFVITKFKSIEGYFVTVKDDLGNEVRLPKNESEYLPVE